MFSDMLRRAYSIHCRFRGDLLLSRRSFYNRVVPRLDVLSPSSTSLFWTFSVLPVFTSSADSSEWTFSATAQYLRPSPIGLAGLFASVRVRRLF